MLAERSSISSWGDGGCRLGGSAARGIDLLLVWVSMSSGFLGRWLHWIPALAEGPLMCR